MEYEYLALPEVSYAELRRKLHEVWAKHAPQRWRGIPPRLEFGDGVMVMDSKYRQYSFTEGRSRIVLCPGQREVATLLHEATHAMQNGVCTHGPCFVGRYFRLLVDEEIAKLDELTLAATRHRLDPRWLRHFDSLPA